MQDANEKQETVMLENPEHETHICKSCGNKFTGSYCNLCGEKVLEAKDRTFKTFLGNILILLTFTDNKFIKTLWMIVRNPGLLSKEYAEGKRVNYLRPLQLFFVLNLVYFLFPILQLFNTSLYTQMYLRMHSGLVRQMVEARVGKGQLALQGYSLLYNDKSTSLAKLLIIVFVILASLPMLIIYRRRNRYFTDHVTLAVELTSFNLAVNAILLSIFVVVLSKVLHWSNLGLAKYLDDFTLTIIFVLTNTYFLFFAGRTFYVQRGYKLLIKVVLGLLGLFVALEMYRLVLFLITYWVLQ